MKVLYFALLTLAICSASVVALYTGLSIAFRHTMGEGSQGAMNLVYAPISVIACLCLILGLMTFLSRRLVFTQIAGLGATTVVLVCVAMLAEAMLKGVQDTGLTFTMPKMTYYLPLSYWIMVPLVCNLGLLVIAQMRSAQLVRL